MTEQGTRAKILRSALKLFMEHGFASTSMSQVAEGAQVTKSLIYHHFKNKHELWRATKLYLIGSYAPYTRGKQASCETLHDFIRDVVELRFGFYKSKPQIARLMMWQRLEKQKKLLEGVEHEVFTSFLPQIKTLQEQGKLNPQLDAQMVEYIILSLAANPIIDNPPFLRGRTREEKSKEYVEFLIDSLIKILAP